MSAPAGENLDILWVRYEDMRSDTKKVLYRVAKWLNIAHDEHAIAWAVKASSAESMVATEDKTDLACLPRNTRGETVIFVWFI